MSAADPIITRPRRGATPTLSCISSLLSSPPPSSATYSTYSSSPSYTRSTRSSFSSSTSCSSSSSVYSGPFLNRAFLKVVWKAYTDELTNVLKSEIEVAENEQPRGQGIGDDEGMMGSRSCRSRRRSRSLCVNSVGEFVVVVRNRRDESRRKKKNRNGTSPLSASVSASAGVVWRWNSSWNVGRRQQNKSDESQSQSATNTNTTPIPIRWGSVLRKVKKIMCLNRGLAAVPTHNDQNLQLGIWSLLSPRDLRLAIREIIRQFKRRVRCRSRGHRSGGRSCRRQQEDQSENGAGKPRKIVLRIGSIVELEVPKGRSAGTGGVSSSALPIVRWGSAGLGLCQRVRLASLETTDPTMAEEDSDFLQGCDTANTANDDEEYRQIKSSFHQARRSYVTPRRHNRLSYDRWRRKNYLLKKRQLATQISDINSSLAGKGSGSASAPTGSARLSLSGHELVLAEREDREKEPERCCCPPTPSSSRSSLSSPERPLIASMPSAILSADVLRKQRYEADVQQQAELQYQIQQKSSLRSEQFNQNLKDEQRRLQRIQRENYEAKAEKSRQRREVRSAFRRDLERGVRLREDRRGRENRERGSQFALPSIASLRVGEESRTQYAERREKERHERSTAYQQRLQMLEDEARELREWNRNRNGTKTAPSPLPPISPPRATSSSHGVRSRSNSRPGIRIRSKRQRRKKQQQQQQQHPQSKLRENDPKSSVCSCSSSQSTRLRRKYDCHRAWKEASKLDFTGILTGGGFPLCMKLSYL